LAAGANIAINMLPEYGGSVDMEPVPIPPAALKVPASI
jgi:hypothetical protein